MFTEADVPNPPLITFAHDIARLNCIWDDTLTFWSPTNAVFFMKGQAIVLVYLPVLYSHWKGQQWDGLKKLYSEWKVCLTFLPLTACSQGLLPSPSLNAIEQGPSTTFGRSFLTTESRCHTPGSSKPCTINRRRTTQRRCRRQELSMVIRLINTFRI